ncbi:MarR family winged helix-turn-helix transcriptional regulator [Cellulomonas phragmiteti]|uniref:MarR family transcriptional regulator n=1 Tax=Cellulomonas phragmiteti TaxID=478780 RepID=A0ABQ4DKV9_9CELL|nr:MarR family winged helix-turn-helix transcriptional regulator [Cellulomonas phragmiteti]GIG39993.1 MarR family transcriptional regulator [Cellulomonas phragmiteti]
MEQGPPPDHWPVGRMLSATARRIERAWDAHLASWDLNHASLPVLVHLTMAPMSQRELADACGVTEQTMSRVVARLVRTDYVTRRPHAEDRRRHVVAITPQGSAALAACADPAPAQQEVLGHLPPERRALLEELMREVVAPWAQLPAPSEGVTDRPTSTTA